MAGWRWHHPGLTDVKAKRLERVQHLLWDTERKAEKTFTSKHCDERHKRSPYRVTI